MIAILVVVVIVMIVVVMIMVVVMASISNHRKLVTHFQLPERRLRARLD